MNDEKTLGQIAYEAYCANTGWKSIYTNSALPQWTDVKPETKECWEVAAGAVYDIVLKKRSAWQQKV